MASVGEQVKWTVRRTLHRFGLDLHRAPQLIDFLRSRDIQTVLDVGANVGQFAMLLRHWGYEGRIVSFEPIKDVYATLEENAALDPLWTTRNHALGSAEEDAEIHVSDYSVFSSILPLSDMAEDFDASARVIRSETIPVKPLDSIFHEFSDQRVFLKIDTQGFEREVLLGATSALPAVCGVQLELPIEHLYEGAWTLADAISFMASKQFVIAQVRPNGTYLPEDDVSFCEMDVVFRRLSA